MKIEEICSTEIFNMENCEINNKEVYHNNEANVTISGKTSFVLILITSPSTSNNIVLSKFIEILKYCRKVIKFRGDIEELSNISSSIYQKKVFTEFLINL